MTDSSRGQSDKAESDVEVCSKQRCRIKFLHAEKMTSTDTHQHLLKIHGDQNGGCEHSEAVGGAFFQQRHRRQYFQSDLLTYHVTQLSMEVAGQRRAVN